MKTWLIINLRVPGFHKWENAPEEHAYLKNLHRHEFHIKVEMLADRNRKWEFIDIKSQLTLWLYENFPSDINTSDSISLEDMPKQSCEGFAEVIAKEFVAENYTCSKIRVTVLEDGENGARIEI